MDFELAESRFRDLQTQRDRGDLDDTQFRVLVAELMFRDEQGTFWMLNADDGAWHCNRGEAWELCDPHSEPEPTAAAVRPRRRARTLAWSLVLVVLLALAGIVALERLGIIPSPFAVPTPTTSVQVQVTIASPADGGQVALGHEIAIESMLRAPTGLDRVDRVELQVDGQTIASQPVRSKLQPGQTSLPFSLAWVPTATRTYVVTIAAFSVQGDLLGTATINLNVAESADEAVPEPACTPDAVFVADVTIPPGTSFRPGAQMDKVWQVRNSGTCAWGVGYTLARVLDSELLAPEGVSVPPTIAGNTADLAVSLQAPDNAGVYTETWQLHSPDGSPFGPLLGLRVEIETQAEESLPPDAPTDLLATSVQDGKAIQLTWQDQSDNEDAFRIHRNDLEASIGLAPANARIFVDDSVTCGNVYRYSVVAFNSAGSSPSRESAEVQLPPCAAVDDPPTLILTVVPTQVVVTQPMTIIFQATDDLQVSQVTLRGDGTGNAELDAGRSFSCNDATCASTWSITQTADLSTTLILVAVARDSSGQESEPARIEVLVRPAD